jgi:FkbM family methyltransferase
MDDKPIVCYFDLGIWDGCQSDWMVGRVFPDLGITNYRVYGFEANKENYEYVKNRFKDNTRFSIYHKAIANENKVGPLYHGYNDRGRRYCSDSIFKDKVNVRAQDFELVEYIRFSDWLNQNVLDLKASFNILKFNIEGAEGYLMRDLVDAGMINAFDIYCGASPDMPKIKSLRTAYAKYQKLLSKHNIEMCWFAGGSHTTPEKTIKNMKQLVHKKMTEKGIRHE